MHLVVLCSRCEDVRGRTRPTGVPSRDNQPTQGCEHRHRNKVKIYLESLRTFLEPQRLLDKTPRRLREASGELPGGGPEALGGEGTPGTASRPASWFDSTPLNVTLGSSGGTRLVPGVLQHAQTGLEVLFVLGVKQEMNTTGQEPTCISLTRARAREVLGPGPTACCGAGQSSETGGSAHFHSLNKKFEKSPRLLVFRGRPRPSIENETIVIWRFCTSLAKRVRTRSMPQPSTPQISTSASFSRRTRLDTQTPSNNQQHKPSAHKSMSEPSARPGP